MTFAEPSSDEESENKKEKKDKEEETDEEKELREREVIMKKNTRKNVEKKQKKKDEFMFPFSQDIVAYDVSTGHPYVHISDLRDFEEQIKEKFTKMYGMVEAEVAEQYAILEICRGKTPPETLDMALTIRGRMDLKNRLDTLAKCLRQSRDVGARVMIGKPLLHKAKIERLVKTFAADPRAPLLEVDVAPAIISKETVDQWLNNGPKRCFLQLLTEVANATTEERCGPINNDRVKSLADNVYLSCYDLKSLDVTQLVLATIMAAQTYKDKDNIQDYCLATKQYVVNTAQQKKNKKPRRDEQDQNRNRETNNWQNGQGGKNGDQSWQGKGGQGGKGKGKNGDGKGNWQKGKGDWEWKLPGCLYGPAEMWTTLTALPPDLQAKIECPTGRNCWFHKSGKGCRYGHEKGAFRIGKSLRNLEDRARNWKGNVAEEENQKEDKEE